MCLIGQGDTRASIWDMIKAYMWLRGVLKTTRDPGPNKISDTIPCCPLDQKSGLSLDEKPEPRAHAALLYCIGLFASFFLNQFEYMVVSFRHSILQLSVRARPPPPPPPHARRNFPGFGSS